MYPSRHSVKLKRRSPGYVAVVDPQQRLRSEQLPAGVKLLYPEPHRIGDVRSGEGMNVTHKPPKRNLP